MKAYRWIVFDADDTLFHFDAFSGLRLMFANYQIDFTSQDYEAYQKINKALWLDYQNGNVTAEQIKFQRFDAWSKKLNISTKMLNSDFLKSMAEICAPLDGVENLLNSLKGKAKLGIITNGFTELQHVRLKRTGLSHHFDLLVISEEVGVAKPHAKIFNYALEKMGCPNAKDVLIVGDNPDSDILGGKNAGWDTCWYNPTSKPLPSDITPHYHVASFLELQQLLAKAYDNNLSFQ